MTVPPRAKRALLGGALALGLGAAAVVGLHTRGGRPLLARVSGCPATKVSPAAALHARDEAVAKTRGDGAAPARPALGFALDEARLADVRAWATAKGIACSEARGGTLLKCADVPASALPRGGRDSHALYTEIAFGFRADDGALHAVTALRSGLAADAATRELGALADGLTAELGVSPTARGDVAALGKARWATASLGYRYADYLLDVGATTLPDGVSLYERYTSGRTGT